MWEDDNYGYGTDEFGSNFDSSANNSLQDSNTSLGEMDLGIDNSDYGWNEANTNSNWQNQVPTYEPSQQWQPQYNFEDATKEYLTSQPFYQGNPQYDPSQQYYKDINSGTQYWKNQQGNYAGYQEQGKDYTPYMGIDQNNGNFNPMDLLAKLFGGGSSQGSQGAQGPTGNRGIGSILNDLFSGNGNNIDNIGNVVSRVLPFFAANQEKKSADEYRQLAENQLKESQTRMDPFAGERRQYMDLLRNSSDRLEGIYNNPMSSSMYVQAQNEMNRRIPRQMSKNRFGMGVNRAMAQQSPELMKAALDDARKTFDMYREPAGANIRPNDNAAIIQAVLGAQKQSLTNPMWSAGGQFLQGNQNQQSGNDTMTQILNFIAANKGK